MVGVEIYIMSNLWVSYNKSGARSLKERDFVEAYQLEDGFVAIRGSTYAHREELTEMGAVWEAEHNHWVLPEHVTLEEGQAMAAKWMRGITDRRADGGIKAGEKNVLNRLFKTPSHSARVSETLIVKHVEGVRKLARYEAALVVEGPRKQVDEWLAQQKALSTENHYPTPRVIDSYIQPILPGKRMSVIIGKQQLDAAISAVLSTTK